MKTTAPYIYMYTLKYYLLHVSARSEGVDIYNCDKFSILDASLTGIVKNVCVLSHRSDITYAKTASYLPPVIPVDHVHVHMLTFICCATANCTPLNLGPGNNKYIDVSLCQAWVYTLHYGDV